ncbi:hypothetical protein K432DRAFT_313113, partial [Lepidopterella palustris CBS 459.81]
VIRRKSYKRQYIRTKKTLIGGSCNGSKKVVKRVYIERYYGRYSKIKHNSRTCKVEIENIDNSEASK